MATGRKTVVVGQVIDPTTWGNPLWDQSVQTFTSAADRTAQFPAPKQGAVTWLEDIKRLEVYTGTAWAALAARMDGRAVSGVTNGSGLIAFAHGMAATPGWCVASLAGTPGQDSLNLISTPVVWSIDAISITVAIRREDTHQWFAGQPVNLYVSYGITVGATLLPAEDDG